MHQKLEEELKWEGFIGQLVIIRPIGIYGAYKVSQPWEGLTHTPGILVEIRAVPNIDDTPSLNRYWGIWNGEKVQWIPTTMFEPVPFTEEHITGGGK